MRHHPPRRSDEYQPPPWKAELRGCITAAVLMFGLMAIYAVAAYLHA